MKSKVAHTAIRFETRRIAELFARAVRRRGYVAHRQGAVVVVKAPRETVKAILEAWAKNRGGCPKHTFDVDSRTEGDALGWRTPVSGKRIVLRVDETTGDILAQVEGERRPRHVWSPARSSGGGLEPVPASFRGKVPPDYAVLGRLVGPRDVLEQAVALAKERFRAYREREAAAQREEERRRREREEAIARARRALPPKAQELLREIERLEREAAEFGRHPEGDGIAFSVHRRADNLRRHVARLCPHEVVDAYESERVRSYTRFKGRPAEVYRVKTRHQCQVCGYSWVTEETVFSRWVSQEEYDRWLWR